MTERTTEQLQERARNLVSNEVFYCVSNLMYQVGQNLEDCARIFEEDYDTLSDLFQKRDYGEAAREFIMEDADLDDLEKIAEEDGYFEDMLDEVGVPLQVYPTTDWICPDCLQALTNDEYSGLSDEREREVRDAVSMFTGTPTEGYNEFSHSRCDCCLTGLAGERHGTSDGTESTNIEDRLASLGAKRKEYEDKLREKVHQSCNDKWVCDEFNLDPDYVDVYEHWVVSNWLAGRLESHGEVVGDFCGMKIWGRCTTGQAIYMDDVIQSIVAD